jgi:hypothetical protein
MASTVWGYMALYKYADVLTQDKMNVAFDSSLEPGVEAPWTGIYMCRVCCHEIAIAQGHKLPAQNHHQHAAGAGPIRWRLTVSHKKWPLP